MYYKKSSLNKRKFGVTVLPTTRKFQIFSLKAAAKDTITTTDPPKAGWFYHRSEQLFKAIEKRDKRQAEYNQGRNQKKHAALYVSGITTSIYVFRQCWPILY